MAALRTLGRRLRHLTRRRIRIAEREFYSEGGWSLTSRLHLPPASRPLPAVLLVPDSRQGARIFEGWSMPVHAAELARLGCVVMALDLAGRGRSWGTDTSGGPGHQGDVRAALQVLASLPEVDPHRIGVISFGVGSVAVAGALAEGDRPPVAFWIDWEGPSDREILAEADRRLGRRHDIDDDRFWYPLEPIRFVGQAGTPYLRYQSTRDHAVPGEHRHAIRMVRAAASGGLPWFQLNDHPRGDVPERPEYMPAGVDAANRWMMERVRELHKLA